MVYDLSNYTPGRCDLSSDLTLSRCDLANLTPNDMTPVTLPSVDKFEQQAQALHGEFCMCL